MHGHGVAVGEAVGGDLGWSEQLVAPVFHGRPQHSRARVDGLHRASLAGDDAPVCAGSQRHDAVPGGIGQPALGHQLGARQTAEVDATLASPGVELGHICPPPRVDRRIPAGHDVD